MNHEKTVIYTCPMHPEVKQEKPGICPQCGISVDQSGLHVAPGVVLELPIVDRARNGGRGCSRYVVGVELPVVWDHGAIDFGVCGLASLDQ